MISLIDIIPTSEEIAGLLDQYLAYTEKELPKTLEDIYFVMMIACGFQIRKNIEYLEKILNSQEYCDIPGKFLVNDLHNALGELMKHVRD